MSWAAPPAQGTWYDVNDVTDKVSTRLRLASVDPDRTRIEQLVVAAAGHIDVFLDRVNPMSPTVTQDQPDMMVTPTILEALERLTVALYIGAPFDDVLNDIAGHRARWGLA